MWHVLCPGPRWWPGSESRMKQTFTLKVKRESLFRSFPCLSLLKHCGLRLVWHPLLTPQSVLLSVRHQPVKRWGRSSREPNLKRKKTKRRWSRDQSEGRLPDFLVGNYAGWEPPGAARTGDIQGAGSAHPLGVRRTGTRCGRCPRAKMIALLFPLKKLRRNSRYLLLGTIIVLGIVVVFLEMDQTEESGEWVLPLSNNMSKLLWN